MRMYRWRWEYCAALPGSTALLEMPSGKLAHTFPSLLAHLCMSCVVDVPVARQHDAASSALMYGR